MKKTVKSMMVLALTAGMLLGNGAESEAKTKKPELSKTKVTVTVGKKKRITVKKVKPKKTTWTLTKSGKKIVSLSKATKTGVYIKGKKAGEATLKAEIKAGEKTYKKTVKITVKKNTTKTDEPTATPMVIEPTIKEDAWVYYNLDTKADYVMTANGKDREICSDHIATVLDKKFDAADFYNELLENTDEVKKAFCNVDLRITTPDASNPEKKIVALTGTDSSIDGTYTAGISQGIDKDNNTNYIYETENKLTGKKLQLRILEKKYENGAPYLSIYKYEYDGETREKYSSAELRFDLDENKKCRGITYCRYYDIVDVESGNFKLDFLFQVIKNDDGTYIIAVDKTAAEKCGFVLKKK